MMLNPRRRLTVVGATMIVLAGAIAIAPRSAAAATNPQIVIRAAASEVTLERWPGDTPDLDFGIHIVAGGRRFQVNITRKSYDAPVAATQIISNGARKQLPAGLVRDLSGLTDFMHLTIANSDGLIVHEEDQRLCPGKSARSSPDAPPTSPFPVNSCGGIPWQLGNVVGVEAGWSTNIRPYVGWPPHGVCQSSRPGAPRCRTDLSPTCGRYLPGMSS